MNKYLVKTAIGMMVMCLALMSVLILSSCGEKEPEYVDATPCLEFTSNGNGTCVISGINKQYMDFNKTSSYIIIPEKSPEGDVVIEIGQQVFETYDNESVFVNSAPLKGVQFSEGLLKIGDSAFTACQDLTSVSFPASLLEIGNSAFSGCTALTSITFSEGLKIIGNEAFLNADPGSLVLPDSLTTIGDKAFWRSFSLNLTSFKMGPNVTKIGEDAFYFNISILPPEIINEQGVLYYDKYLLEVNLDEFFRNEISNGEIRVKSGTKLIADGAFALANDGQSDDKAFTAIILPEGVEIIGNAAFRKWRFIPKIYFPASVKQMGSSVLGLEWTNTAGENESFPLIYYGGSKEEWEALDPMKLLFENEINLIKPENVFYDIPVPSASDDLKEPETQETP